MPEIAVLFGSRSKLDSDLQPTIFVVESVMKTTEAVLQGLLKYARPEILKEFRADSCIASTAVGLDILMHYGILAEPFPVRTLIFNEPFTSRLENGQGWPTGQQVRVWTEEDGSYSVGIGVGTQQPNKWAGYLAILVEKRLLLDLSIDQATRPQYNMMLEPLCVEIDEQFISGSPKVFKAGQCVVRVDALLGNEGYTSSPDWLFAGRRRKIVANTLRLIQGEL